MRRFLAAALLVAAVAAGARAWDPVGGPNVAGAISRRASLSHDGKRIAFETTARLSPGDLGRGSDIYVVDTDDGVPRLMPRAAGSAFAARASLSADGKSIAYHVVERMGTTEVEAQAVVVVLDLDDGDAKRVPPNWWGKAASGEALAPALSKQGRHVAFTSNAPRLAVKRKVPVRAIFVYEPATDQIRLISRAADGTPANRPSAEPAISADGRVVGFLSAATNLEPRLPADSLETHLYLADRWERKVERVDTIEKGFDSKDWLVGRFDMDADADHVVFEARQRRPGKPFDSLTTTDLFLYEASSGTVTRLTTGLFSGHSHSPAVSANGRWTAFIYSGTGRDHGGVVVYDRKRDLWRRVADGACGNPAISGNGRWVAFESGDKSITGAKDGRSRVYMTENPSYEEEEAADAGH